MKYLSKEELEDITNELLENPTRETLKVLNNKYNSEENGVETKSIVEPVKIDVPEVKLDIPTFEVPNTTNTPESNTPNMNIPTFNIPGSASVNEVQNNKPLGETIPISSEPTVPVNNNINDNIPSLEVPQSVPVQNNNAQVNFSGNLWEPQMPTIGNMMETTDNFNTAQNTMPNTNPNIQNTPFFGQTTEPVNNPIPVNNVPNINNAIRKLKDLGYWIVGTDMEGTNYTEIDYKTKIGLVIGNEGKGISKVTADNCDYIAKIPMKGTVNSLNASVACGIFLSEINRSRGI